MSSLCNAGLSIVVAREATVDEYGQFAIAFSLYSFFLATSRALTAQPFSIRSSAASAEQARADARGATASSALFGVFCACLLVPVGLIFEQAGGYSTVVVAFALPGLFVQEAWRTILVARKVPRAAFLNDLTWGVLQFSGMFLLSLSGASTSTLLCAWGISGWFAAGLGYAQFRLRPTLRGASGYLTQNSDISRFMFAEAVGVLGASQIAMLTVAAVGSLEDTAAVRGATTLLGPLNIFGFGIVAFAVPELVRMQAELQQRWRAVALLVSGSLVALTVLWVSLILVTSREIGVALLGASWDATRNVIAPMALWSIGSAVSVGPRCVLRAQGEARSIFRIYIAVSVLLIASVPVLTTFFGAVGAAWAFATSTVATIPLWWMTVSRKLSQKH